MNILLVSECSGNALAQTRRILDQFSERRGERVWQTTITLAGLETLRRMLRQKARKNTAVACYRMYGSQTELLWIVGTASRFNEHGAVPTNRTKRDVLRAEDENTWHSRETILLLSRLAALWHDMGKSCAQFQRVLRSTTPERNLIRHEWISLRLFEAFVGNDEKDENWLQRMADFQPDSAAKTLQRVQQDVLDKLPDSTLKPFKKDMPPLARAISWLIVSHHRLPTNPEHGCTTSHLQALPESIVRRWNESETPQQQDAKEYWKIPATLFTRLGPDWQKEVRKCAARFLKHPAAKEQCQDTFVLHLSRLTLMLADHKVSAQETGQSCKPNKTTLFANTGRDKKLKQTLEEHLVRVAQMCSQIAYALPAVGMDLPRLAHHRSLRRRCNDSRFRWQDKAVDACNAVRQQPDTGGVFLLNMASTGCGKTLANIRMLYALHPPEQGMRATFALGLRVLTTQTGREYQNRLHLSDDELAVRVGGLAAQELYDLFSGDSAAGKEQITVPDQQKIFERNWQNLAEQGQESARALFADDAHVLFEGNMENPVLKKIIEDGQARKFLSAPILACTVDHLVPATESLRGGHQILPMLRLLGSDLVLDEIDDYGLEDLPAIARLTYWAGMLGCRVLVSSATLPPALATGLFTAYREGRAVFERNLGQNPETPQPITCVWADEFGTRVTQADEQNFAPKHNEFASNRADKIGRNEHRRRASLLDVEALTSCTSKELPKKLASVLLEAACRLHADNHTCVGSQRVSFGLLRMANIKHLRQIAKALASLDAPQNTRIHLLAYHSRFPLALRTKTEELLDRCLNRKDLLAVFNEPEIRAHLQQAPHAEHIFLVIASPICEVGRDWDADWAIVEPSSMRSFIQLVGRIRRHRPEKWDITNVLLWSRNFKGLTNSKDPAFSRPGFETRKGGSFPLTSHSLHDLLMREEYEQPDSRPRLLERKNPNPKGNLTDLEHARLHHLFVPEPERKLTEREKRAGKTAQTTLGAFSWWQYPQSMLTGLLQQTQMFRRSSLPEIECLLLPDENEEKWVLTAVHKNGESKQENMLKRLEIDWGQGTDAWLNIDIMEELHSIAEQTDLPPETCARKFFTLTLPQPKDEGSGWTFNPLLGFDRKN